MIEARWEEFHGEFGLADPTGKVHWNEPHETLHDHIASRLGFKNVGHAIHHGFTKFVNGADEINVEIEDTPKHRQGTQRLLRSIGDRARPIFLDVRKPGSYELIYSKEFRHAGHANAWLQGTTEWSLPTSRKGSWLPSKLVGESLMRSSKSTELAIADLVTMLHETSRMTSSPGTRSFSEGIQAVLAGRSPYQVLAEGLWPGDKGYWSNHETGVMISAGGSRMFDHYVVAGQPRFAQALGLTPQDSQHIKQWTQGAITGNAVHDPEVLASLNKLHQKNARIRVNDRLKEINVQTHGMEPHHIQHVQSAIYDLHMAGHEISGNWVVNHDTHGNIGKGLSLDLHSYANMG